MLNLSRLIRDNIIDDTSSSKSHYLSVSQTRNGHVQINVAAVEAAPDLTSSSSGDVPRDDRLFHTSKS